MLNMLPASRTVNHPCAFEGNGSVQKVQQTGRLRKARDNMICSVGACACAFLLPCLIYAHISACPCLAQLYEEVCISEGCTDLGCANSGSSGASSPATILLLPPQFSIINETRLPHLVRTLECLHQSP